MTVIPEEESKMKKLLAILISALLICCLTVGCSQGGEDVSSNRDNSSASDTNSKDETAKKDEYVRGDRTATEWSSEWIGLKYTLGSNFIMTTDEELDQLIAATGDAMFKDEETGQQMIDYAELTDVYEMMAVATTGDNIIVMAQKLPLANMSIDQYITSFKSQNENLQATMQFSETTTRNVAGLEFSEIQASMSTQNGAASQTYLFTKIEDRIIAIILTAVTEGAVDNMLAGFSAI